MSARSKARKRALDVIYAAEVRGRDVDAELSEYAENSESPLNPYTETLVVGVSANAERIDEVIAGFAEGWSLERMPAVDRNILRIGAYELLFVDDVPDAVAISEAVNLARDLSTDESPAFVNGVLGNVARDKVRLLS